MSGFAHTPGAARSAARQALHSGVIGCLGVALAWLLWVAVHAFERSSWQVLAAPIIGAMAGMAIEFLRHHVRVSAREAREGPSDAPALSAAERERVREAPDYSRQGGVVGLSATLAGLFLLSVCSNLVSDMMSRLVAPFLVTLALFFPIGLWLGFVFRERDGAQTLPVYVARGLLAGVGAAAIAFVVSAPLGLTGLDRESLLSLFGWWVLLGLGWGLAHMDCDGPRPFAPLAGTILAALLLLGSAATSSSSGVLGLLRYVADPLSGYALAYPGLPSRFWERAAQQLDAVPGADAEAAAGASDGVLADAGPQRAASPAFAPSSAEGRRRALAAELALGARSELARSWLVLLLFGAAVGVARWSEARLRPLAYHRSETRRNDAYLALGATAVWIGGLLYLAIHGW